MERHITVSGFVVHEGKVALHWHRTIGAWLPAGGHIEENEDPVTATLREVKEEFALDAEVIQLHPRLDYSGGPAQFEPPFAVLDCWPAPDHGHIDLVYFLHHLAGYPGVSHDSESPVIWFDAEMLERGSYERNGSNIPLPPDVRALGLEAIRLAALAESSRERAGHRGPHMIDIRQIRADPDRLKEIIRLRKVDPAKADVERWLALDERRRALQTELDGLNSEKKRVADLGKTDPAAARARGQELREKTRELEAELSGIAAESSAIMDWFPNLIDEGMPRGAGEEDNVEESAWVPGSGYLTADKLGPGNTSATSMPQAPVHADGVAFKPLHYTELGELLGGIDTMQGGKVSGSRFAYILGDIAVMQLAIQRIMTDELLRRGYQPIIPPLLVRERSLYGTSHFPEGRDQVYEIRTDNVEEPLPLFLVGSSEPANFSYFMDRTLDEAELPFKVFAYTPCFRSEAGSWGRDVRGIKRVHQFDKLEMNAVTTEAQSAAVYEEFGQINEWLLQQLQLPYRVIDKCSGDAGYLATYRQRDIEVWMSGSGEYMEVMTDTNTTDYQARRLNIRYRPADSNSLRYAHTVNDTGVAMGRMLIAILDNYQQPDGSVLVPSVLRPVLNKDRLEPKKKPS